VKLRPARTERLRHVRKYAVGELPSDVSSYSRGPQAKLNLRAHNLQTFVQLALGVDDETWLHHLRRGDYSAWFRRQIKDEELADETAAVERDASLDAEASRRRVKEVIERRYTAPA
jgi:hypothetical protein